MKKFLCMLMVLSLITLTLSSCGADRRNESVNSTGEENVSSTDSTTDAPSDTTESITTVAESTTTVAESTTTAAESTTTAAESTTTTTKKPQTTTKKPQTTTKPVDLTSHKYEVALGGTVTVPAGLNIKQTRAWALSENGIDLKISRIEYGTYTQKFDSSINKQIVNPKTITFTPTCTVAVITCDSPTRLNISTSGAKPDTVEQNAKNVGALIAINGTAASKYEQEKGATIRAGSIYRPYIESDAHKGLYLVMYKDGRWEYSQLDNEQANAAVKNGAYNTVRFQDITIQNGQITYGFNDNTVRNRTFLGKISPTQYVFVTTEFMPIKSVAEIMLAYGVTDAVQINGGNCTTMYLKGVGNSTGTNGQEIVNRNKLGYYETEWYAMHGMLAGSKKGGPCDDEIECIYFK